MRNILFNGSRNVVVFFYSRNVVGTQDLFLFFQILINVRFRVFFIKKKILNKNKGNVEID